MFLGKNEKKKKLIEDLFSYLDDYPDEVTDFMDTINHALKNYKHGVEQKRNALAQNALGIVLTFLKKDSNKRFHSVTNSDRIPILLDAMFYFLPDGDTKNLSNGEKEIVNQFIEWCREVNLLEDESWKNWLINHKGEEYYNWIVKLLKTT